MSLTPRNYNLYGDFTAFISLSNINLEAGSFQRIFKFFEVVFLQMLTICAHVSFKFVRMLNCQHVHMYTLLNSGKALNSNFPK